MNEKNLIREYAIYFNQVEEFQKVIYTYQLGKIINYEENEEKN